MAHRFLMIKNSCHPFCFPLGQESAVLTSKFPAKQGEVGKGKHERTKNEPLQVAEHALGVR